jgi:hypothetical protein
MPRRRGGRQAGSSGRRGRGLAGGCAALLALVLDITREQRVLLRTPPGAWNWMRGQSAWD